MEKKLTRKRKPQGSMVESKLKQYAINETLQSEDYNSPDKF